MDPLNSSCIQLDETFRYTGDKDDLLGDVRHWEPPYFPSMELLVIGYLNSKLNSLHFNEVKFLIDCVPKSAEDGL